MVWTPCSGVEWGVFEPASRGSGTTCKQPVNLAVEGAEEFLSMILSDYTPTVRPPPKRS